MLLKAAEARFTEGEQAHVEKDSAVDLAIQTDEGS